jgi:hypothetical protein
MAWDPNRPYVLWWTHLKEYEECALKFLWSRGWGKIDLGGGPGRKKPLVKPRSREHAVMGISIQAVIEELYNEELWRTPASLKHRMKKLALFAVQKELKNERNWIDWRAAGMGQADIEDTVVSGVLGYLKTMKAHKLLGPYARAEVELFGHLDKYNKLGGYVDTIIRRDDTGITILDGKNSKTKMEYVDPDQLRFYALLFYLSYDNTLPDRAAFVWYRFPYDGKDEQGLDWVPFTERDLQGLASRSREARKGMNAELFDPKPSSKACQYCNFKEVCPARVKIDNANAEKRKDLLPIVGHSEGFVEFDMDTDGQKPKPSGKET